MDAPRTAINYILDCIHNFPSVAILGPRQIGKTTIAQAIATGFTNSIYLDLENPEDFAKLQDPGIYFQQHIGKLIILDEIQRFPDLFPIIRGAIDRRRKDGYKTGQFLFLGSASGDLLQQSSESLAGRIIYTELSGFSPLEVEDIDHKLWLRGGFPDSFLAKSDKYSLIWRNSFIKTYLERDIPQMSIPIAADTLRNLWTMIAHIQGGILNTSTLALSMGLSVPTINRYLSILSDLFLIRLLKPYYTNIGKRLTKAPKIYIRDSGIAHALLNISSVSNLLGHPIAGGSFEGFVIENILYIISNTAITHWYYRTSHGAEIDLLLTYPDGRKIGIEIKLSSAPKLTRGFYTAYDDLKLDKAYVVYPGNRRYHISENVEVIGLKEILIELGSEGGI